MKKTMKYISMAALALVGAVMTSCSSDDDMTNESVNKKTGKVETFTMTLGINAEDGTRALSIDDSDPADKKVVKTFAVGDQIAVIYQNTSNETVKAVSEPLTEEDITQPAMDEAQFTVDLIDAKKDVDVTYIYPAAMASEDGSPNYDALANQDGTLDYIAANLDYCEFTDAWDGGELPVGTLENKLVICALTLKDALGASEITSSITNLTMSDGSNTYNVTRSAVAGPIYVAIRPTTSATINYYATGGKQSYAKYVTSKTYAKGSMHRLPLRMAEVVSGKFTVNASGKQVYFSKGNLQATTSDYGSTWTWKFGPNQYARVGGRSNGGSEDMTGNNYINGNGTVSNDGNGMNIDLFGWSTSTTYLGINNSTNNADYREGSITDGSDFVDWGSHSDVIAGIGKDWRTLNKNEWRYLMETRGGNRFALASINGTRGGIILLPDDWNTSYYSLNNINDASVAFTVNTITYANWTNILEAHGAVFLPVTGQRNSGTTVNGADEQLHYWSSSGGMNGTAPIGYHLRWMPNNTTPEANRGLAPDTGAGRCNGYAVRLVYDVK